MQLELPQIITVKEFGHSRDGKRTYQIKSNTKHLTISAAQEHIHKNNFSYYDLIVDGKVIDRNGNGTPTKGNKSKKPVPLLRKIINAEKAVLYIQRGTGNAIANWYELKKDSGQICVSFEDKKRANDTYAFVQGNGNFNILDVLQEKLMFSLQVCTDKFNETLQWQPKEIPTTKATKSQIKLESLDLSGLEKMLGIE